MLKRTVTIFVRYQPFALAYQSRFRWRHREVEGWNRLMDASCFCVDWIGKPRLPDLSKWGGHWSHIVTCAHVTCPWDYPNFYPPVGSTKWVSRVTASDCQHQVRVVSLQGEPIYKHFLSLQGTFIHTNPRLDLAVVHSEQFFKRAGEQKMLWMQNQGYNIRPRFEVLEELKEGDYVWMYGMAAQTDLLDEEKPTEPYMIPTGVKGRVKSLDTEHFFVEPLDEQPEIIQGFCGGPIIRNGRCVGMLTATVHPDSENKTVAGTAMCTYAKDIRDFLIEVEKQMNSPAVFANMNNTPFQTDPHQDPNNRPIYDWEDDESRLARHIKVPAGLFKMEENSFTEEDRIGQGYFHRSGPFNQDTQENVLGLDMTSSSRDSARPESARAEGDQNKKPHSPGERADPNEGRIGVYSETVEPWKTHSQWESKAGQQTAEFVDHAMSRGDINAMTNLKRNLDSLRTKREMADYQKDAMKAAQSVIRDGEKTRPQPMDESEQAEHLLRELSLGKDVRQRPKQAAKPSEPQPPEHLSEHQKRIWLLKQERKAKDAARDAERERAAKYQEGRVDPRGKDINEGLW